MRACQGQYNGTLYPVSKGVRAARLRVHRTDECGADATGLPREPAVAEAHDAGDLRALSQAGPASPGAGSRRRSIT